MARSFLTAIDLNKNELRNAAVQNLGTAPSSPVRGQLYYNSTGGVDTLYWWNGTSWISAVGGMAFGVISAENTFGTAKSDGVATTTARSDHTHGNPVHDAAAHAAIPLSSLSAPFAAASSDVIFGSAKIDGTSNSASRADHTHGNPTHVAADHAAIPISALAAATGAINMGGFQINNLPNSPSSANDAASKMYVDNAITGLTWKNPVDVASTAQVALTGTPTIDGVATALFNRVLLKNQTAPAENGIWQVNSGAWTRVTDADIGTELIDAAVYVKLGTTQADTAWVCTTDSPLNIGTTAITWVQFAGSGMVVAGSGLSQSGNTLNVGATNASIVVAADDISVGYGGTGGNFGAAATAARSDHVHTGVYPPVARLINTTAPLTGGGDLSADRTLAINNFGSAAAGAVPASGGGTANYLRADGTWAVPPVDTATGDTRYSRKFSAVNIGGALSQLVTHNLSNFAVLVNVYRTIAPGDTVECDVERTNANQITLRFAVAPATNEYSCVVVG